MSKTEALLQTILQNQQGILEAQQTQATAMEILSQSVQALEQSNDNLILRVNQELSTLPHLVRGELENFIEQFKAAMDEQKSEKMAESIAKLVKAMEELSQKMNYSGLTYMQLNAGVETAAEEIKTFKQQLKDSGLLHSVMPTNGKTPPEAKTVSTNDIPPPDTETTSINGNSALPSESPSPD